MTVSRAPALVTEPAALATRTAKRVPLSLNAVLPSTWMGNVAPAIAVPSRNHWKVNGKLPAAITVNVAGCPAVTDVSAGADATTGINRAELTRRLATELVMLPAALPTRTLNRAPSSPTATASVV